MPADAREVDVSLRAVDLCWRRFPYYEARWGERGLRFSRSDGVWLATLSRFEPAQISQQVDWLGRVLSSRGMPTLLLQEQLEMLYAELVRVIPERRHEYEKLLAAAAELLESRRRHVTDAQSLSLAAEFDRAVGTDWSTRMRHTGALLVAAVADDLAGHHGAISSLEPWMTDAARFPPEWVTAVRILFDRARQSGQGDVEDVVEPARMSSIAGGRDRSARSGTPGRRARRATTSQSIRPTKRK